MRVTTFVKQMLPPGMRPLARRMHVAVLERLYPGVTFADEAPPGLYVPTLELAEAWGEMPAGRNGATALREAIRPAMLHALPEREAWRAAWERLGPERCRVIVSEAQRAAGQRFDVLGSGLQDLGPHIDWHVDFKTGAQWKLLPIANVPIIHDAPGADIKVPWELSRFYHAPVLGVAHLLTGEAFYARAYVRHVTDWIRNNPLGFGPNWVCAMEAAIRVGNWIAALPYVLPDPLVTDEFLEMLLVNVFEHGRHIRGHLEGTDALRSNHYLADLQGLIYTGLQFPRSEEARGWVAFAAGELEREILAEVFPDGTDFEASTAYHRLCLELFLGPALLCRQNGVELSAAFWSRLKAMFDAVRALIDGDGHVPLIGDNDSGRLHRMVRRDDGDLGYLLPIGAVLFGDPDLKLPGVPFSEEAMLCLGPDGFEAFERLETGAWPDASAALPDSGWYVLRAGEECLHLSCGPNGQPFRDPAPGAPKWNGGHAHNDKLSLTYTIGGTEVLVDPGQYCYTSDQALRNHSRSTASHNVAQVNGLEQQRLRSDYLFNIHDERAAATVLRWAPESDGDLFVGEHCGFVEGAGVRCRRSISIAPGGGFRVVDSFPPADPARAGDPIDVVLHFHAAPGHEIVAVGRDRWRIGTTAEIGLAADVEATGYVDTDFVAPAYGERVEASVLRVAVRIAAGDEIAWTLRPTGHHRPGAALSRRRTNTPPFIEARVTSRQLRPKPHVGVVDHATPATTGRGSPGGPILYTRLDYWNSRSVSGGSFGHTAHVIRAFDAMGFRVVVAAGFYMPMVDPTRVSTVVLRGPDIDPAETDYERQFFEANRSMGPAYERLVERLRPAFIYERLVVGNHVAARTAQRFDVPYVLEYNGSEIWARRHWAKDPYRHEADMTEIEERQVRAADLVVVVSEPLRAELIGRGVHPERILVNPNAVDPVEFDPARRADEGRALRRRLGFGDGEIVIGFIGTFGAWHGIDVLAAALPAIVAADPRIRVLLIGDGGLRPIVERAIGQAGIGGRVVLTGLVPQDQAPVHLAACDMFLSPHHTLPDDDRPFFGSPTKLLEYMAMDRPTVASALGQIETILSPALRVADIAGADPATTDALGVLVAPGNERELALAIAELVRRPDLGRAIAANAKRRVVAQHTWDDHVRRIADRLDAIVGAAVPV